MTLLHTVQHPSRIHDVKFCQRVVGEGEILLVGAEDKNLSIYDIPKDSSRPPTIIAQMIGHGNRFHLCSFIAVRSLKNKLFIELKPFKPCVSRFHLQVVELLQQ